MSSAWGTEHHCRLLCTDLVGLEEAASLRRASESLGGYSLLRPDVTWDFSSHLSGSQHELHLELRWVQLH